MRKKKTVVKQIKSELNNNNNSNININDNINAFTQ